MPAPSLRTVRRSRSQSVETALGFFMVSPEAADNRSRSLAGLVSKSQKKSYPRPPFFSLPVVRLGPLHRRTATVSGLIPWGTDQRVIRLSPWDGFISGVPRIGVSLEAVS